MTAWGVSHTRLWRNTLQIWLILHWLSPETCSQPSHSQMEGVFMACCKVGWVPHRIGKDPLSFHYMANLARVGMRWYPGSLSWRHLACVCEGPSRYFCTSRQKGRGSPVLTFRVYCVPLYKEVWSESYKRQCKKIPWIKSSSVFPPTPSQFYPNNKMLPQTKPKTFWRS